jgi:nitrate reductase assembly molybdenum cofactor insertion protein NarJ
MDRTEDRKAKGSYGQETLELADLARFRQAAYRLFSTMLLYPEEERLRTVTAVVGELADQADFLAAFSFFIQWRDLLDVLQGLTALEPATVQEQYVHIFMANPHYAPCLPYESVYAEAEGPSGWTAVELERVYAAAGLALASSLREAPDHAAVELEFMSFLCKQEACAWEARQLEKGIDARGLVAALADRYESRAETPPVE